MEEKKQEILDRIAKLLTLAKDKSNEHESDNAQKMASKLMAKYRIAESEIDLDPKNGGDIFEDEEGWEGLCDEGGKRQWVSSLGSAIARTFDCSMWINSQKGTLHFIGTSSDLETVLYFMDSVFSHIEREARKMMPRPDLWKKRNIFGQAAEMEVSNRLAEMKRQMDTETKEYSGGYDLVIVKNDLVQQTAKEIFKQRGFGFAKSNFVKSNDSRIINAGREAGKRAPLNLAIA